MNEATIVENPSPKPTPTDVPQPRPFLRDQATPERYAQARAASTVAEAAMVDRSQGRPPFNELSVLFPILAIYTVGYLALMVAEFLFKGKMPLPVGMMPIYIALVGAYAADKEVRRWIGNPEPSRHGALFVYLWLLLFLVAFVVRYFRPEYQLPAELSPVVLQVLAIFFGSRASKYVWQGKSAVPSGLTEAALALIREQGNVSRKQIEEKFNISGRSANRLLAELEAGGLIRREGEGKGIRYLPAGSDRTA